jgi:tRNA threonylcarbamoyladenosine biosynthesis protein TsaE
MYKYISNNEEDTIELAQNIESEKFPNMVICLNGDLGVGKTVFTKGFAHALEVEEDITSPTFNIIKEYYSGQMPLFHVDAYRIEGNIEELGLEEYYHKKGIVIIEWSDLIEEYLPKKRLDIKIKLSETEEDTRIIYITPYGEKYEELCEAVL